MDKVKDFQNIRMKIFRELISKRWKYSLSINDLNKLANEIINIYNFNKDDSPFIKDHIRVILGQNPNHNNEFKDELEILNKNKSIESPILTKIEGICSKCKEKLSGCKCYEACKYEAQMYVKSSGPVINEKDCLSCGRCTVNCTYGALADKIEFMPLINLLEDNTQKVYAAVAPSITGQFGKDISMGKLRSAFKIMGFEDMVEVALFADILTIKEAYEFNKLVTTEEDFFLTSCCCPIWMNLIRNNHPELLDKMSPAISPMIASGRFLKELYPESRVVFIGPCTAKKAEAREPYLEDAIDYVLTYQELKEIFRALKLDTYNLNSIEKDHGSFAGRVYGRTGGVSLSVKTVVNRIAPKRVISLKSKKVAGVKKCMEILKELETNKSLEYNFIEGMGCEGGCVGGPKTNIEVNQATQLLNEFGEDSAIMTPMDNMNIIKILGEIGLDNFKDIFKKDKITSILKRRFEI